MTDEKTAIILLGGANDPNGVLSSIAVERCRRALDEYRRHPGSRILLTGGWGPHFNTATRPHCHYLCEYLRSQGVPEETFVECAESSNTVEDAELCQPIVERHGFRELIVVTSDFHVARAGFLFRREFPGVSLKFSACPTDLPDEDLQARILHEQRALARLQQGHAVD
jgi:uncharacterized SAM-binding protein YcdF (DUF218 family)